MFRVMKGRIVAALKSGIAAMRAVLPRSKAG
jgi:hypothetical protein